MEEIVVGVLDVCQEQGVNPTGALAAFVCQTVRYVRCSALRLPLQRSFAARRAHRISRSSSLHAARR